MDDIKTILASGDRAGAGLPYLYREKGLPGEVYEVRMNQEIQPSLLNRAIADAVKRYPYFSVKFEERDGDFFVVENDIPLEAHHRKGAIPLGGHTNNYHLMGITFWENTLYLSSYYIVIAILYLFYRFGYAVKDAVDWFFLLPLDGL